MKYIAFITVLTTLFCFSILFLGKTWMPTFILDQTYPWKAVLTPDKSYYDGGWNLDTLRDWYRSRYQFTQYVKNKELPLWDASRLWGTPYLADGLSTPFDPLNSIFLLFPFNYALNVYTWIQLTLGSVFMYFFVRSLRVSGEGSMLSALLFSFTWVPLWMTGFPHFYNSLVWMPLSFFAATRLHETGYKKYSMLLFISIIIQFIAGSFELTLYSILFLIIFLFLRKQNGKKFFLGIVGIIILAVACTSFQLFPTIELSKYANRPFATISYKFGYANLRSVPPWHVLTLVNPFLFGSPYSLKGMNPYVYYKTLRDASPLVYTIGNALSLYRPQFWHTLSIGTIGFIFLFFSFIKKNKYSKILWLFLLITFLWSTSGPVYGEIFGWIPVFSTIQTPERMILMFFFFAVVLSGFGYDQMMFLFCKTVRKRREKIIKIMKIIFCVVLGTYGIVLLTGRFLRQKHIMEPLWASFSFQTPTITLPLTVFLISVISILFVLKRNKLYFSNGLIYIFIALILIEGFFLQNNVKTTSSLQKIFPETAGLAFLQSQKKPFRVAVLFGDSKPSNLEYTEILPPNLLSIYNIDEIGGHGALNTKASFNYLKSLGSAGGFTRWILPYDEVNWEELFRSGVDYIVIAPHKELHRTELSLVYRGDDMVIYSNTKSRNRAYLESGGNVSISVYRNNNVQLIVDAKPDDTLVLLDQQYPGWNVYIDRQKGALEADSFFKKISISEGNHTVEFRYEPASFIIGLFVSIVSLIVFLLWHAGVFRYIIARLYDQNV